MGFSLAQTAVQIAGVASQVGSGFAAYGASNAEARNLNSQADLARQEAYRDASARVLEVQKFRERQAGQYMMSGVALAGSPLLVLEETRKLGQQEVDAIVSRGDAISNMYRARAQQAKMSGRMAFLGSLVKGLGQASSYFSDTSPRTDYSKYAGSARAFGSSVGSYAASQFSQRRIPMEFS